MNKKEFLRKLEEYLYDYDVKREVVKDILNDHEAIIDEAIENGKTEEEIITRLGRPKDIAKSLRSEASDSSDHMLVALSPFVATAIYVLLGFVWNLWHPGWLVFMIIPIAGVLFEANLKPVVLLTSLSPFITTIIFFLYAFMTGVWHPTWIVFLFIPLIGLLNDENTLGRNVSFFSLLGAIVAYLLLQGGTYDRYAWLVFMVPAITGVASGHIQIGINFNGDDDDPRTKLMKWTSVGVTIGYIILGLIFNLWHPGWLIFLLIPVVAVVAYNGKEY